MNKPACRFATGGAFQLPSVFAASPLAAACQLAAAQQLAALIGAREISSDLRLGELWCRTTLQPQGWTLPDSWDPVAGNYRAQDGWIRLHTNVLEHRAAALGVLGVGVDRDQVARAVAGWKCLELEQAIIEKGGVAAAMLGLRDWAQHPQGQAVAQEPLIHWREYPALDCRLPELSGDLNGLRVLDLTRVLAGPVATRFVAGFGARVLRIDPPHWREDGVAPEMTLGKACAGLDLRLAADRGRFERLLSEAHVLVHGYRPGALAGLGYDEERRRSLNPHLTEIALCAYGWSGPWRARRGFDTIVQMHTGLAQEAMHRSAADEPVLLPIQALDHGTGYLMAAALVRALHLQRSDGKPRSARLSLARTARLLMAAGLREAIPASPDPGPVARVAETTHWGPALRVRFPVTLDGRGPIWRLPAGPFRSSAALWP